MIAPVVHCLSVDVEGFAESMVESFPVPDEYLDETMQAREIETNVRSTLDLFARLGITGTFFVLGRIARDLPEVVRQIATAGHEIGSHSFYHKRVFGQTAEEFEQDVVESKQILEKISGKAVSGFRAPDFSITSATPAALDILKAAGFEYDASFVPTDLHDVYGNPGAERSIHRLPNQLWEFPIATFRVLGRAVPFGGGGYLRLFPLCLTRTLLTRSERRAQSCMLYMHPYELGPEVPLIRNLSFLRRFRHYHNIATGGSRIEKLVRGRSFEPAISIIRRRSGHGAE